MPTSQQSSGATPHLDAALPIGVFDSGMGGLTVLRALRDRMPQESFIYLGDTARLPYGTKTPQTVSRYARQAAAQLVDRGVKALVIACNTASAFALKDLQEEFAPLPVFGVVEPGAQAVMGKADHSGVLVLATESTISGGAYQRALAQAGARFPIYGRACPLWVTLAEQGANDQNLTNAVLSHYLRGMLTHGPSTVLLGCTHFPVFTEALERLLAAAGADKVRVVDSASTTAAAVSEALAEAQLNTSLAAKDADEVYLATDGVERFAQVGSFFLGHAIEAVELVDL